MSNNGNQQFPPPQNGYPQAPGALQAGTQGGPRVPPGGSGLPPASPSPRRGNRWLLPVLGAVVAIGIGLVGGILIGQHTASSSQASTGGFSRQFGGAGTGTGTGEGGARAGGFGGGGGFAGGGFTSGTVVSVSGASVVIKTAAGNDVTVTTTPSTKVTKSTSSSVSALKAGESVTAIGTPGSNGDVAATTISEGATLRGGFGRGGAGAGAAG